MNHHPYQKTLIPHTTGSFLCVPDILSSSHQSFHISASQKTLPYYHGKRVLRKNGVLAVLLSFIYSGKIEDTDGWTRDVRAWVKMTFVTKWNALMVIQNGPCDEKGYVHMLLIPVTNEGKISYDHYFGGCYKLRALQSSYHQLMISRHGLKNTPPGSERIL